MPEYEFRDGVPYVVSKPMSAREAMDENRPLPDLALWILGWGKYADGGGFVPSECPSEVDKGEILKPAGGLEPPTP